ncbi:MAG: precorrin-8X methylmutase, partial [Bacteroidota bacterium]
IHPYLLYKGRHFEEDITEMITDAQRKYPEVEFVLTEPLGVHKNIAMVVLERAKKDIKPVKILKASEIEEKSFELITEEMDKINFREINFRDIELPIVKRVIHASGDFEFAENMRFHPKAVESGIKAIKKGMNILVDVEMVKAGINKKLLEKWGGKVICGMENGKWKMENDNKTKTEIGIEIAVRENNNIGIVAIGNAPTALYRAMKLIRNGIFKPELVIGVPVGFVNAVESKEVLLHMKYPFITSLGRKGGSPIAAAIVNALLKIAEEGGGDR